MLLELLSLRLRLVSSFNRASRSPSSGFVAIMFAIKIALITANSRVHRLLTFDTRGVFYDSMEFFAHGAMSMIRVHSRSRC